jgi:hypothetical protein
MVSCDPFNVQKYLLAIYTILYYLFRVINVVK